MYQVMIILYFCSIYINYIIKIMTLKLQIYLTAFEVVSSYYFNCGKAHNY